MIAAKKVFEDLVDPVLLERCIGGRTQNNESLNHVIWNFCPKEIFSGLKIVEIATYLGVATLNDGACASLKVMTTIDVTPGKHAREHSEKEDQKRIRQAEIEVQEASLETRRSRGRKRLGLEEQLAEGEDNSYSVVDDSKVSSE